MKIEGGMGKKILRTLLCQEAPKRLFERPKTGFGIPVGEWIRGPLRDWAEDLLDRDRMASEGWFDPEPVLRRWRHHLSGSRDSTDALWSVLTFNAWLRKRQEETATTA
jgi:asparagine synthase (glutamine-hydrolysing)